MANDLKGEVRFEVDGTAYKLRFTTNALYEHLEKPMRIKFTGLIDEFDNGNFSLGMLRQMIYAGLKEAHVELTVEDTGHLIDQLGLPRALELVRLAFAAGFGASNGSKKKKK